MDSREGERERETERMEGRERCQYGGVMVARYEGSLSGQGRSVTLLHWYLGQGNREGGESGEKKANEVMKLLKWRFGDEGWRASAGQCHLISIENGQPGGLGGGGWGWWWGV